MVDEESDPETRWRGEIFLPDSPKRRRAILGVLAARPMLVSKLVEPLDRVQEDPALERMLLDGHVTRTDCGAYACYEITDAGRAWLVASGEGASIDTTEAETKTVTRAELRRQATLPHVCSKTVSARECPPCAAHYALADADGKSRARRDVLVNAVLAQARKALDCLDLRGAETSNALGAAFSSLDAYDEAFSSGEKVQLDPERKL